MNSASIFAEAIRNNETLGTAKERLAIREHVARNYRAVALPALAAALQRRTDRQGKAAHNRPVSR